MLPTKVTNASYCCSGTSVWSCELSYLQESSWTLPLFPFPRVECLFLNKGVNIVSVCAQNESINNTVKSFSLCFMM